ncbi:hypothetical protein [Halarchaeum sp. P4]|uniref:hypothetical protein n=1 Tax=Halarchaeum sp. P4 TaxID=3421639 RepID=UPI003EBE02FF
MDQSTGGTENGTGYVVSERLDPLLVELCDRRTQLMALFAIAVLFLGVQLPYLFVVESGTALFVVSVLNVVALTGAVVVLGAALWYCRKLRRHNAARWS